MSNNSGLSTLSCSFLASRLHEPPCSARVAKVITRGQHNPLAECQMAKTKENAIKGTVGKCWRRRSHGSKWQEVLEWVNIYKHYNSGLFVTMKGKPKSVCLPFKINTTRYIEAWCRLTQVCLL